MKRHPDRFSGLAGLDPTEGMHGVRELERAVRELGFIGAHMYPHWFELAPDHARWYPFYSKCVELDVPVQMQVGQSLIYTPEQRLRSVGRPITLDAVACDFPELKLVGIHVGIPWADEMIAMAWKHPNVYIGCDAHSPKYWPESFVHYINSFGKDKVLFGTDYPVLDFVRTREEIEALGLREHIATLDIAPQLQIFATDIDGRALAAARTRLARAVSGQDLHCRAAAVRALGGANRRQRTRHVAHESKADAMARAREMAKQWRTELVIKNKDGTIAQRDSYSRRLFPPRDKKR